MNIITVNIKKWFYNTVLRKPVPLIINLDNPKEKYLYERLTSNRDRKIHKKFCKKFTIPFGKGNINVQSSFKKKSPKNKFWRKLNNDELLLLHEIRGIEESKKFDKNNHPRHLFCAPNIPEFRLQLEYAIIGFSMHMERKYGWLREKADALEQKLIKTGYIDMLTLKDRTLMIGVTDKALEELLWYKNTTVRWIITALAIIISIVGLGFTIYNTVLPKNTPSPSNVNQMTNFEY